MADTHPPDQHGDFYDQIGIDGYQSCHNCKKLILDNAKICTHCDSFQNWRRYLNLSSTALSLLIALFTSASLFLANIDKIWPRSNIELNFHTVREQLILLSASNSGNRPGYVTKADLIIELPDIGRRYNPTTTTYFASLSKQFGNESGNSLVKIDKNDGAFVFLWHRYCTFYWDTIDDLTSNQVRSKFLQYFKTKREFSGTAMLRVYVQNFGKNKPEHFDIDINQKNNFDFEKMMRRISNQTDPFNGKKTNHPGNCDSPAPTD